MAIPSDLNFTPSRAHALQRASSIDPTRYARTRNFLGGDVTRLSPYITHGLVTIPELLALVHARHALSWQDKLVFEFGWREYFQHAWHCLHGELWREPHAPPAPASAYAPVLPADIRGAFTGVAIIDQQIAALYATGYLHNHARMWIASYVVHIRKVSWRAGARWMYSHLLDGDLASNTLSWQWVAGTWTGKPYLFNAENVARYAPGVDCAGSVIDTSYETLDAIARSEKAVRATEPHATTLIAEPELTALPPANLVQRKAKNTAAAAWIMHPWSLHLPDDRPAIGIINTDFHARYRWSAMRWQFVMHAMNARCVDVLVGGTDELAAALTGKPLGAISTLNPFFNELIARVAPSALPAPRAFDNPTMLKRSFTSFWNAVSREKFPV
jgi:deoxyribodipyrimidine photo-lyase